MCLVSHAQTDWNVQGRFQGQTDIPLNEFGRDQALALQQKLSQENFQAIVASDLRRARETAEILAKPHGMIVQTDPRLRELNFGEWEGLTYAEIQQKYPRRPGSLAGEFPQDQPTAGGKPRRLGWKVAGVFG